MAAIRIIKEQNMKAIGIVAEFNPFYEGHKYLIDSASALTEADVCVSVMSGNFVQRGGPAFYDKWKRAEMAVKNGVDLVVEMPQCYGASSAAYFASAGVRILDALNCENIAFGSETGDISKLSYYAEAIRSVEKEHWEEINSLNKIPYPAARTKILNKYYGDIRTADISGPNDILGIEYLNAIDKYNSGMIPITVMRKGKSHGTSASFLREKLLRKKSERDRIRGMEERYFSLIKYKISTLTSHDNSILDEYDSSGEGLGNKLAKEMRNSNSLEELIERTKTKKYTWTRVSRLISHIVLDIYPADYKTDITYIRPLAFNEKGRKYLKEIKKTKEEKLIFVDDVAKFLRYTKDDSIVKSLKTDVRAGDIYNIISGNDMYAESEYIVKPAVLSSTGF